MKIHGHRGKDNRTPTYNSWRKMKERCLNFNEINYHDYGGRGITFDPTWKIFTNFLADMGERPIGKTLDRIDGPIVKLRKGINDEIRFTIIRS